MEQKTNGANGTSHKKHDFKKLTSFQDILDITPVTAEQNWSPEERQGRIDLAAAYQLCYLYDFHENIDNHLTYDIPGTDHHMLVIRHGLLWNEVTPQNLIKFDVDGNVLDGAEGKVEASAFNIHARFHFNNPEHRAVFHTHMAHASSLTCIEGGKLEMCHQNSLRFYNNICYPDYNGLVLTKEEGDRLAAQMGDKDIMMHDNHGVMVCNKTIGEAWDALYFLEKAAKIQVLAMSTGKPLKIISDTIAQEFMDICIKEGLYADQHFDAMKRDLIKKLKW